MVNHCFKNEEIKAGHSAGLRDIFFRYFSEFVKGISDTVENAEGAL